MKANNIIIRDAASMKPAEVREAIEAAIAYDIYLNDKRKQKDPPVVYRNLAVHETSTGTIVVNKKTDA